MYRTIDASFWTDPAVRKLSVPDKLLLLYFITNPAARISGLYCIDIPTIAHQIDAPPKSIEKGIDTLSAANFIQHDAACEVVWVRNMLRYQAGKRAISPKIQIAVAKDLDESHNSKLIPAFMDYYADFNIPYTYRTDRVSVTNTTTNTTTNTITNTTTSTEPPAGGSVPFDDIVQCWNETVSDTKGMAEARGLSEKRREHLRKRWKEDVFREKYQIIFNTIVETPFLSGQNERGWRADFDWIIKNDDNYTKVLEGKYGGKPEPNILEPRAMTPEEEAYEKKCMAADWAAKSEEDRAAYLAFLEPLRVKHPAEANA